MKDINEIKELIPHRYPILMVDRLEELEPGHRAKGVKNVSANEPFLQGHFPDRPLMPGVLQIEAMAQVGACALMSLPENEGKLAVFGGVDKVKFKRQVQPGDVLSIEVELTRVKGSIGKGEGKVYVGDELAAQGQLTFALVEK
ncbi:3-hydroxyacyl-ACP dehydratase FabZ [Natranaerobius thermophilus]|uniref:3-hydroxyacyl-[acyl-carrier-protein] dehydratase FabZ n=1 Tax=Natranaerobius thermophilus (strain ATCC BAA-1301 / DSM 18059 / JW/NM-WN-LF) TaxID=457570 RepID=FABZ_NATTJ|nr:3-hydroxyacyl-ACP dehydratase FabZ [Natranaerobius thermophilus]B2A8L3.1 RecName: Full=3-hydroxyacyl-[acyl-carrier-protein] dehydratase FabZ; AltName: Full=(3R)-hydroxymyristoyl-[acyl-carrier-protein] dehydratase; Short=(3R)-hydroxymyristoyl-ACP dehydrase; AltName: Full=Beta-hydroxyacyl-ACP dehydratase [Natranaerobius thermophilus JW/NM-WN-LF]ACB85897.1 3-hydroxyacyl-(acyl-carrier-protein) dehydratase [Natranaerobius thermophilus JW/NM-WN-LF]